MKYMRGLFVLMLLMIATPAVAEVVTADPVVVTAARMPEELTDVSASVTVVTSEEIAERGTTRLDELLQDVVGLHVVSNGQAGSVSSPSIRGSEASQVLVLIDGVRLNSPQYGQFDLNQLPVRIKDIERIEVLRGAASALYGSNALGGVIHVITKAPAEDLAFQLGWTEGSHDTRIASGSVSQRIGDFRYRLGAEGKESEGYRENSEYEQYTLNGLLGYSISEDVDLELTAYHLDYDSGIPGTTLFPSPQAEQQDKRSVASVKLEAPVGPVDMTVRGIYERHRNDYTDPGAWTPLDDTHEVETQGGELAFGKQYDVRSFLLGGDYFRDDLDSTNIGDKYQERGAMFGQYQAELMSNLSLLLGLRYDIHSDFDNEWSPRAALLVDPTDTTLLRFSANKAYRAPTLNDLYWDDPYTPGNPDLVPETAWEYELALEQEIGEGSSFSVAGFLRDAEDLIQWQPTGPNWWDPWTPENVGEARIWGVECAFNVDVSRYLELGGNYTYLNPKDREDDTYLPGKPKHEAHASIAVKPFDMTSLRFDGRYLQYYQEVTRTDKDYFVGDLSLAQGILLGGVELEATVAVKNLFDKEYEANPGYPMPPREWFAGMTATF